jgi:hypothetical protein
MRRPRLSAMSLTLWSECKEARLASRTPRLTRLLEQKDLTLPMGLGPSATGGRVLGKSDEFRKPRHAIEKAHGDRDQAIRKICRLYGVKTIDALQARSGRRRWRYSELLINGSHEAQPCRRARSGRLVSGRASKAG